MVIYGAETPKICANSLPVFKRESTSLGDGWRDDGGEGFDNLFDNLPAGDAGGGGAEARSLAFESI
ncbi:conserved protein of unknown function [Limnospira indica PCC 8005]|uniref:Uncharacterized protein n=1 Tax=Limnospira indica PCC 8005 TaxID=376219 RepID=A0A9P1KJA6_9CYAN|nr:conserved protein of unknown function [Limnospira indica PCC 8005]